MKRPLAASLTWLVVFATLLAVQGCPFPDRAPEASSSGEAIQDTRPASETVSAAPADSGARDSARIEALEDSLATFPTHADRPAWLWELGGLWRRRLPGHICPAVGPVPALARKYERYFRGDCCECWYHYTHAHWKDLVRGFPDDSSAADAAYLLTSAPSGGECEGWVACWIETDYGPLEHFLRTYPASPQAADAVQRANEAFAALTFRPEAGELYKFDSTAVRELVARYDSTAITLAAPLRVLAYGVIGPIWAALGNASRAAALHHALIGEIGPSADTAGLRQAWDSLVGAMRQPVVN
jgi:hypothetical protein